MPFDSTKIERKVSIQDFVNIIKKYKQDQIECTEHTFARLSEKQRKIFTCKELRDILTNKVPFLAGIQYNSNYAVFYKYDNKNLKIILGINLRKVNIVTFYFIEQWQIPNI